MADGRDSKPTVTGLIAIRRRILYWSGFRDDLRAQLANADARISELKKMEEGLMAAEVSDGLKCEE